jgi:small subunit ribosomal protein S17e|tara:strand:- start:413 stop:640 length:228 start_codon:yes stop_codon:yes gene_type:complete
MDRVKRIAYQVLDKYGENFTADFEKNKEIFGKYAFVSSKQLRNEIVGYITKRMKDDLSEEPKEDIEATPPEVNTI